MRIVRTTDGLHLGHELNALNTGETVDLDGFTFVVQAITTLENGNKLFSNFNYQLECEEI